MIKVNEYFAGKIKSLGFELHGTQYTAGVILPGEYSIDTEKEEHITLTVGGFEIRPPDSDWKTAQIGDTIVIPANSTFDAKASKPVSYICMYR
jgi:uncharacterized protein YaiE (UPF0345 family)